MLPKKGASKLLIKEVTKHMNEMGVESNKETSKFRYGNYYRFYPSLNGEGKTQQSDLDIPR